MKYTVVMSHSYDPEVIAVLFDDYDKAKAYLHWKWEDYYNAEIAEDPFIRLNEELCYHEDEYARVTWEDEDYTEFILVEISEPDDKFANVDWKRYI